MRGLGIKIDAIFAQFHFFLVFMSFIFVFVLDTSEADLQFEFYSTQIRHFQSHITVKQVTNDQQLYKQRATTMVPINSNQITLPVSNNHNT